MTTLERERERLGGTCSRKDVKLGLGGLDM